MLFFQKALFYKNSKIKALINSKNNTNPEERIKKSGVKKPPMEALAAASVDRALETINFERKKLSISALLATP